MTRNDTSYRTKGRAVFLAAIMVLSMVAMSVAFAGGAAATEPKSVNEIPDPVYPGEEFNTSVTPGGQFVDSGDEAFLVEIERDGGDIDGTSNLGTLRDQGAGTGDNFYEVDTSDLEAGNEYGISNTSSFRGDATNVTQTFSAVNEGFSAEFDDDSVDEEDNASEIELDSDRAIEDYNLTISVDGPDDFDADMLDNLFNISGDEGDFNADNQVTDTDFVPMNHLGYDTDDGDELSDVRDDGYVTLNLAEMESVGDLDGDDLLADFEQLDANEGLPDGGEYEFEFIVADTASTVTDTVEIDESDEDADFSQGTYQGAAGDIAHFEYELEDTDEAWIQIGDANSDFLDVLYVQADDEDEPVEVSVNTRLLGTNQSDLDTDQVYDVENEDGYESAYHDHPTEITTPTGLDLFEDDGDDQTSNLDDYFDALGIDGDGDQANTSLDRPLQPTDYELQIAGTDVDDALFDADAGDGEANDQLDSAVLELQQPEIGEIITHTAPEENADDVDNVEDLVEAATAREDIALEDRLIVQVEATGIYGAMVANPTGTSSSELNPEWDHLDEDFSSSVLQNVIDNEPGVDFEIIADEGVGNQDPLEVDIENAGDSEVSVIADNDEGQFFVIVNTEDDDAFTRDAPEDDTGFTATLEYDADNGDDRFEFDRQGLDIAPDPFRDSGDDNYPYLRQGNELSSSAEFDLVEREINFDNLNADDEVQAENVEDSEISGETNIAPGSDAEIRVSSTDASTSFRIGEDVDINEDGEISAEYDFSGQEPGDEFDTRFRASGTTIDTVDSVIVAEGDLGVEEPVEDDEDDVVDDDDDVVDDDDDEVVDDDDDVEEPTDDETPGFGALVALVALIGAALLAVRRQNN